MVKRLGRLFLEVKNLETYQYNLCKLQENIFDLHSKSFSMATFVGNCIQINHSAQVEITAHEWDFSVTSGFRKNLGKVQRKNSGSIRLYKRVLAATTRFIAFTIFLVLPLCQ